MGWANASVRHPTELPDLGNLTDARGVVREDPLETAMQAPGGSGTNGFLMASPLETVDVCSHSDANSTAECLLPSTWQPASGHC